MLKTTSEITRLSPLGWAVLKLNVDYVVRTCDSSDPARRLRDIAALRTAVVDVCAEALRDAIAAGAAPDIAIRDLLTQVHGLELRLQDLAPRVELVRWVEFELRQCFGSTVRESADEPTEATAGAAAHEAADKDQHATQVEKLHRYIKANKLNGGPINSKAAFLRSLRNGRGMDRQSLARWEKRLPTLAPGHGAIIEAAIDKFPEESPTPPTVLLH